MKEDNQTEICQKEKDSKFWKDYLKFLSKQTMPHDTIGNMLNFCHKKKFFIGLETSVEVYRSYVIIYEKNEKKEHYFQWRNSSGKAFQDVFNFIRKVY